MKSLNDLVKLTLGAAMLPVSNTILVPVPIPSEQISIPQTSSTPSSQSSQPLTDLEQISGKIAQLHEAMQKSAPGYESLLFHIHKVLSMNEDLSILLTEEQIGTICAGLAKRKNIVIATAITKGNTNHSGKKLSQLNADVDL